jgi:hypothetical protein
MGCYDLESIEHDFSVATKGDTNRPAIVLMIAAAKNILSDVPDNQARDFAISNLLKASDMVACAYVLRPDEET